MKERRVAGAGCPVAAGAALALSLLLLSPAAGAQDKAPVARPFIRVEGTRFMEGARPFYFVGANLNVMHGPEARGQAAGTIAAAAADGLKVGRVWALGEGTAEASGGTRLHYLFRVGPEGWQEEAYQQLDRVVAEAGRRQMRLVITLSNRWKDYGGIPMYLRWAGYVDVEAYGYEDRFFVDPSCKRWFVEHVKRIVGRVNSITGVPYRDDPAIMTWELMNEMSGTPEAGPARASWVEEMARTVRELDPNHLVVPGLIGYNLQVERQQWLEMNRLPGVSYCDQHVYPEERARSRGAANLGLYVDDRVQLAHHVLNKPIVFGEFGFADQGSQASRARWHRRFLERVFFDGGDGAMVWIYQPDLPWKRRYGVLWDRPRHQVVRRALAGVARELARGAPVQRNRALSPELGTRPIAPTHALLAGRRRPHGSWTRLADGAPEGRVLSMAVDQFSRGWWEEAGAWDGGVLVHAYGRDTGWFEYSFTGPGFSPSRLELRARLSSELPGSSAPVGATSRVKVSLDGAEVASLKVRPDDGRGAWYTVTVSGAELLRKLARGRHTLRFSVEPGPEARGVAIYGREAKLNREPVEDPGPLQVTAYR